MEMRGIVIPSRVTDERSFQKANLIKNKKTVGRLQDLADVEALEAVDESP